MRKIRVLGWTCAARAATVRARDFGTEASVHTKAKPGSVLKSLRLANGWTLAEVSRRTGLPVSTLSKVENDKMSLSYDKLARISRGLEIDIGVLFSTEVTAPVSVVTGRRSITRAGEGRPTETERYG